jgi:hypothetical protein
LNGLLQLDNPISPTREDQSGENTSLRCQEVIKQRAARTAAAERSITLTLNLPTVIKIRLNGSTSDVSDPAHVARQGINY